MSMTSYATSEPTRESDAVDLIRLPKTEVQLGRQRTLRSNSTDSSRELLISARSLRS